MRHFIPDREHLSALQPTVPQKTQIINVIIPDRDYFVVNASRGVHLDGIIGNDIPDREYIALPDRSQAVVIQPPRSRLRWALALGSCTLTEAIVRGCGC